MSVIESVRRGWPPLFNSAPLAHEAAACGSEHHARVGDDRLTRYQYRGLDQPEDGGGHLLRRRRLPERRACFPEGLVVFVAVPQSVFQPSPLDEPRANSVDAN